jgi:hypothetical protein
MATLSASFVLGGMLAFVTGRLMYAAKPWRGLLLMSGGLGLGTLLSVATKENGALLPVMALCTEFCLLRGSRTGGAPPLPRWWTTLFLVLPTALILAYLTRFALGSGSGVYPGRSFTLAERLMTESRVLWEYLRLLVVPLRSAIGPFREVPVSTGLLEPVTTLMAILGWCGLLTTLVLARNPRWRVLRFGVLWFLAGHLLESTVVGLEIYFEHRNYLPAFGIFFCAACLLLDPGIRAMIRIPLLSALLLNEALVLRENSRLWEDPLLAGALWHQATPGSLRALQLYAYELGNRGSLDKVRALLHQAPPGLKDLPEFQLYSLELSCDLEPAATVRAQLDRVIDRLSRSADAPAVTRYVLKLQDRVDRDACPGLGQADVDSMLALIVRQGSGANAGARAGAHYQLAKLAMQRGDFAATMLNLEQGFALSPDLSVAVTMIQVLRSAGNDTQAEGLIEELEKAAPQRPFVHGHWIATLDSLRGRG